MTCCDGIPFPLPRLSTMTIMSFLSYRDAVQLHEVTENVSFCFGDVFYFGDVG